MFQTKFNLACFLKGQITIVAEKEEQKPDEIVLKKGILEQGVF